MVWAKRVLSFRFPPVLCASIKLVKIHLRNRRRDDRCMFPMRKATDKDHDFFVGKHCSKYSARYEYPPGYSVTGWNIKRSESKVDDGGGDYRGGCQRGRALPKWSTRNLCGTLYPLHSGSEIFQTTVAEMLVVS